MLVEEVINRITSNVKKIDEIQNENKKLLSDLKVRPEEDWDWVSVSTASKIWDISICKMYHRIQKGDIRTKKFENKIYVSLEDVKKIDDKETV